MKKVSKVHMNLITDRIHEGRCVAFLGAGANVSSPEHRYQGLPLGGEVAMMLAKKMELKGKDLENLDLTEIAQEFELMFDRHYLIETLKKILHDQECEPSHLLRTLAMLPFDLIVTLNYDLLMEKPLEEMQKQYKLVIQNRDGFEETQETIIKWYNDLEEYGGTILYKFHGTFDDDRSPIIITEDDYIDLLSTIDTQRIGIPRFIIKRIISSTLLFFGYSLVDWDFRSFLRILPDNHARNSFAILKSEPRRFWFEMLRNRYRFEVYNIDQYDFVEQMKEEYLEKYGDCKCPRCINHKPS